MGGIFFMRDVPGWGLLSFVIGGFLWSTYSWWKSGFSMELVDNAGNTGPLIYWVGSVIFLFAYLTVYMILWVKKEADENAAKKFEFEQVY